MKTRFDPNQIIQFEHDEETHAKRVKIVGTQIQVALSADDGDSVLTVPKSVIMSPKVNEEFDLVNVGTLQIYLKCMAENLSPNLILQINPLDEGDCWVDIPLTFPSNLQKSKAYLSNLISNIMCRKGRIVGDSGAFTLIVVGRG